MTAARVDNDDRAAGVVGRLVGSGDDPQQGIVDRVGQVAPVDQHVVGKLEQQRVAGPFMGQGIVATLAQGIPEQQAALPEVGQVFPAVAGAGRAQVSCVQGREDVLLALAERVEDELGMQALQLAQMPEQRMKGGETVFSLRKKTFLAHACLLCR